MKTDKKLTSSAGLGLECYYAALLKRGVSEIDLAEKLGLSAEYLKRRIGNGTLSEKHKAEIEMLLDSVIWSDLKGLAVRKNLLERVGFDPELASHGLLLRFARDREMEGWTSWRSRRSLIHNVTAWLAARPKYRTT